MHSCIFNQRSTRCSDGLHHLILFLPARPFLGLVGEADPAPVSLHLHYGVAGIYSLLFLFTRCISTPFIFACNALSAVLIWKIFWGVCSWGSFWGSISPLLLEGVPKLLANISNCCLFRAICWVFSSYFFCLIHRSSWRSPVLSTGFYFTPFLFGRFLRDIACPKRLPVFSGIQNSLRDFSVPSSDVLESLLTALLFRCSVTKKVSWDLPPDIQQAYFGGRLSYSLYRGLEN